MIAFWKRGRNVLMGIGWMVFSVLQASAHDYWLEANPPQVAAGGESVVNLMFGVNFAEGVAKPLQRERTGEFRLYGQRRKFFDLLSTNANNKPAAQLKLENEGTALVTMERTPANIGFGRPKFLQYAAEEGNIISEQDLPVTKKRVRETYTRYLKTLLQVGPTPSRTAWKIIGQKYEIIPVANPYAAGLKELELKILFDGKPVPEAKVTALQRLNGRIASISAITNKRGKCIFPITQTGRWLIRSVKIVADPPMEGPQANYRSYWASLTFGYE